MRDVNSVVLMCRLTRDPELRSLASGTSVCSLRVAWSTTRKNNQTGQWEDQPNYADVTVWGAQGESCAKYLSKGRQVCVQGGLRWREWTTNDGAKRQALDIVAEQVQFTSDGTGQGRSQASLDDDLPVDTEDFVPATGGSQPGGDADIPFAWEGPVFEFDLFHAHENR